MKFIIKSLITMIIFVLSTSTLYPQYLVELSQNHTEINSFSWYYENENSSFATIEHLTELEQKNIVYKILDKDIETGKYFWVTTRFDLAINANDLVQPTNSQLLWTDRNSALVKVNNTRLFTENLPRRYFIRKINFHKKLTNQNENLLQNVKLNKNTNSIQSIIDSVSLAELYLTEEQLTGLRTFWINGQEDSMQSRYSYSPQIYKAQAYLESRFEEYGYAVEYLPFAMETFYDIQFDISNPNYGWLVTVNKIFGTQNNGLSWSLQHEGNYGDIWSVFALDQNTAIAVGDNGTILKTSDGASWQQLNASTNAFLFGVHFKNSNLGWICGDSGLLYKTINGGTNWSVKSTPTSQRLYDIFFINDSSGWAVGRSGAIIHTIDYGETWTSQSTPTSSRLYGIHFIDDNNGFAVGWDGVVLHTSNRGTNWTLLSVPSSARFYDIDFIDQNTGMITGMDGACLTTTNGGSTWQAAGNILQKDIYGFDLINANDTWAGGSGIVASSSDFGTNWTAIMDSIPSGSLINLIATKTGIQYPDQHYIICAHYDAITYTTPMTLAPGADDNGSGTAAVIEAARIFKDYDFNYSVKFILFPGEEQGLYGSEAYATNAAATGEQILGVLNMDMIAWDSDDDGIVEIHAGIMPGSQAIGIQMVANINNFGLSLTAEYKTSNSSSSSDHSPFWNNGFPAIMHIEDFQDFNAYYHSDNDLLIHMNLPYFLDNAKLTIGTLAQLAVLDTTSISSIPTEELIPGNFVLYDPYPNPFNPAINIEYTLNKADNVSIKVYNILGEIVKIIVNDYQSVGNYKLTWDGKNMNNQNVASGIYLMKMESTNQNSVKKLVLMR